MNADPKEGRKFDQGKAMMSLLPPHALLAVGRVLTFGAKKYAPNNWKYVSGAEQRYMDAALRHIFAYISGEQNDPETNENHLAHAMCCLLFKLDADESGWKFPAETQSERKE